jgi:membrane dipeptidase
VASVTRLSWLHRALLGAVGFSSLALCRFPVQGAQGVERPIGVVDLHVDLSYQINYKNKELAGGSGQYLVNELLSSGVEGVVLPLYIPRDVAPEGPRLADLERSHQAMVVALAKTKPYQLPGCSLPDRVRTWFSFEGSAPFADPTVNLDEWLQRGAALFGLVHTYDNALASSSGKTANPPKGQAGLTASGRQLVQRLLRRGALVDVSHASDATAAQVIALAEEAKVPVVASHSNARALANHARNLSDELLQGIARTGGVVGINFHSPFLIRTGGEAALSDVVKHVRYVVNKIGVQHVAIGSDFEGDIKPARDLHDVRGFPKLAQALQASGLSKQDVRQIMGLNALRVLCGSGAVTPQCLSP